MKILRLLPRMDTEVLFAIFALVILTGGFITVDLPHASQEAFAGEAVFAAEPPDNARSGTRELSGTENPDDVKPCIKDGPVACVGVDVSQVPYPGCTSGKRCTLDTSGRQCSMPGVLPVKKCQTVNMSGVCSCQCIQ
jgi:hypothetical protein